jgi:rare lipoprotein A
VVTQVDVKPNPQLYVQAGAFTLLDNAQKLQKEMNKFGNTNINLAKINATEFYRVRIGPLANNDNAVAMLKRITQAGVPNPRIVID